MKVLPDHKVPSDFYLDWNDDLVPIVNPFLAPPTTGDALRPPLLTCTTGDHPTEHFPLELANRKTGLGRNLLLQARQRVEFWTVLSLRRPDGVFQHLAHFKWFVSYDINVDSWIGLGRDPPPGHKDEHVTDMIAT